VEERRGEGEKGGGGGRVCRGEGANQREEEDINFELRNRGI
jgi:hypothetical protein